MACFRRIIGRSSADTDDHVDSILVDGFDPATVLTSEAQHCDVAFITVASSGRSGLADVLVGSVTVDTVRFAACPVLVTGPSIRHDRHRPLQTRIAFRARNGRRSTGSEPQPSGGQTSRVRKVTSSGRHQSTNHAGTSTEIGPSATT
jgi:hypothetical protein